MFTTPCWRYEFDPIVLATYAQTLHKLMLMQPGARVWLVRGQHRQQLTRYLDDVCKFPYDATHNVNLALFWWKQTWPKCIDAALATLTSVVVEAPIHCALTVDEYLVNIGLMAEDETGAVPNLWSLSPYNHDIPVDSLDDIYSERPVADGVDLQSLFPNPAELRPGVLESLRPFQPSAIIQAKANPWLLVVWACGAGKTRAAILAALTRPGPVLVIAPSKALYGWQSEVKGTVDCPGVTTLQPYVLVAESRRRKKDGTLAKYLAWCKQVGQRPFVIASAENIYNTAVALRAVDPTVLIFDEIHDMSDPDRWSVTTGREGETIVETRKTGRSKKTADEAEEAQAVVGAHNRKPTVAERETRAVSLMQVSRFPKVELRIGLSATPLGDGRHLRLYAPLDLLAPDEWGTITAFKHRYCVNYEDPVHSFTGKPNVNGSSCKEELRHRARYLLHEVTHSETHGCLPPVDVSFYYLRVEDQDKPDAMRAEIAAAEKALGRTDDEILSNQLANLRLQEASTTKRSFVIGEAIETLKGGGHVAIFTARIRDTEIWAMKIAAELAKYKDYSWARQTHLLWGHGERACEGWGPGMVEHGADVMSRIGMVKELYGGRYRYEPTIGVFSGGAFGTSINGLEWTHDAYFAMLPFGGDDLVQWRGRFDRGGFPTRLRVIISEGTYDERMKHIVMAKLGVAASFTKSEEAAELVQAGHASDITRVVTRVDDMVMRGASMFDMM